jgi:tetratricopeptide (TPR) repeat protein
MSNRSTISAAALAMLIAAPALASFGGGSKPESPPPSTTPEVKQEEETPRQQAERLYADAYDEVAKAKQDLADGKAKNAEKKFKKAIDRGQRAVELDPKYHEAWNLVGYSARKLKDYDRSLAAYDKCLVLKPDYVPAREYLGEAYLELGKPAKAREQLAWLERVAMTSPETGVLRGAIAAYDGTHPAAAADSSKASHAAPADSMKAAPAADSSATGSGGR